MTPLLLALALAAAPPPGADDGEVRLEASLHLRWTAVRNRPSNDVLLDPATLAFDLDHYLVTEGQERHGAAFASFRLDGRHLGGDLRWTLALDTGQLRVERPPAVVLACPSLTAPTGLRLAGPLGCGGGLPAYPLQSTGLAAAELTSNGRSFKEELAATLLVREARVAYSFGRAGFATVRAGRSRTIVADGLIHDDYATGLDVALDLGALGPPFEVRAAVFQPTRDFAGTVDGISPMAVVRVDWLPSLFEHAGLFLAGRRDSTGSVASLLRDSIVEDGVIRLAGLDPGDPAFARQTRRLADLLTAAPGAEATLRWAGASGSLLVVRGHRLDFTAAIQWGALHRLPTAAAQPLEDVPLSGRAVDVRWTWSAARWLDLTPWCLYLSGDRPPPEKVRLGLPKGYAGFLGVSPYVTATNLFFQGGLSETFAARLAAAPGVSGRGVIAPGLTAEADLAAGVALTGRAAWLRAEDTGPYGGRTYGTELDLTARWPVRPWLSLGAEGDVLLPGDFFGGDRPVSKVILGLDLLTP